MDRIHLITITGRAFGECNSVAMLFCTLLITHCRIGLLRFFSSDALHSLFQLIFCRTLSKTPILSISTTLYVQHLSFSSYIHFYCRLLNSKRNHLLFDIFNRIYCLFHGYALFFAFSQISKTYTFNINYKYYFITHDFFHWPI